MSESKPYLTDAEIAEITEPLTQGAARIRYFERLGCKVSARPNGQPLVGRAEFEAARTAKAHRATTRPMEPRPEQPRYELIPGFKRAS